MKSEGTKILIVEDDPHIRFGLSEVFQSEGYAVAACERGDVVEETMARELPDLLVLDIMLPGRNGYEICKGLRRRGVRLPILMLTSKGQEIDKVVGLDCGADDYVTKPFSVRELVARVNALLRRCEMDRAAAGGGGTRGGDGKAREPIQVGSATVDLKTYEVSLNGSRERLTPKEIEVLRYLDKRRGEVASRDEILDAVWGIQYYGTTRTLDQCVAQLRKKLGDAGASPRYLITVHGVGYKLEAC